MFTVQLWFQVDSLRSMYNSGFRKIHYGHGRTLVSGRFRMVIVELWFQVDSLYLLYNSGGEIYGDYDCMLNRTNIGNNNSKYYVIRLIEKNGS